MPRNWSRLLKGIPAKINLIPFNKWPGSAYECSDWEQIEKFADFINANGYASPIRTPRGRDILAACGQLKSESERMRKKDRDEMESMALQAMMIAGHGRRLIPPDERHPPPSHPDDFHHAWLLHWLPGGRPGLCLFGPPGRAR
jgi:hypothetical protein